MYPDFFATECIFTPKKMIQNAIDRGTAICSQIVGHANLNPSPETPRRDMPEQTDPIMSMVKTQNPSERPATT